MPTLEEIQKRLEALEADSRASGFSVMARKFEHIWNWARHFGMPDIPAPVPTDTSKAG